MPAGVAMHAARMRMTVRCGEKVAVRAESNVGRRLDQSRIIRRANGCGKDKSNVGCCSAGAAACWLQVRYTSQTARRSVGYAAKGGLPPSPSS